VTTAENNKEVMKYISNKPTKLYRPMVVFDYDKNKPYQQCFSLTHKSPQERSPKDQFLFYGIGESFGSVVLTNPIEVPTEYLKVVNYAEERNKINLSTILTNQEKYQINR
jgi:hypothetical protein